MRTETQIKRLKKWLIDLDMTQRKIAKECGVTQALVSHVIRGKRKNKKVIDFFLSKGCPRDLLED
jgi:predicted transcriptional regulator